MQLQLYIWNFNMKDRELKKTKKTNVQTNYSQGKRNQQTTSYYYYATVNTACMYILEQLQPQTGRRESGGRRGPPPPATEAKIRSSERESRGEWTRTQEAGVYLAFSVAPLLP